MKIKQGKIALSILLAGSLLAAGCGDKPAASDPKSEGSGTAQKTGGTLSISLDSDPPKLDPFSSTALVDRMVFQSIFDKLVDLDEKGDIIPMLAEKWDVSPDQKSYTFTLKQGVKFHDGTDFNAEAVKFNFERNMDKASNRKNELNSVEKVTVSDPYTVKVDLSQPYAPFLSVLTDRAGMMVSPAGVEKYGEDFLNHPIGTGPFVYKERQKGSSITLEKNANYWQKGLPYLDKVEYKIMNDANVALMNLKSGQVDITNKFPFKEIENAKNDTKISVINESGQGYQGLHLNTTKAPFDVKELRQAVDLLIDRDAIVKVVLSGAGSPAHSPFAKSQFAYGDSDKSEQPNVDKAKELLKKAGKESGFTFTLKIGTSPTNQQVGQMIQNMMKPAGITVNLEKVEFGTMLEQAKTANYEAVAIGWSGRPDPDLNIYDFAVTGSSNNYPRYSNKEVDRILGEARVEGDQAKRKAKYDEAMRILNDEVPYIYFYHDHNVFGLSNSVEGFTYVPDGLIRTVKLSKK
ncbi:peptide ABC transporter substrate-binding protein [Tumebacillus algifaecis]|uniref:Peptide ABC transporter substrate-binding protein n=1 Tax=Tumebacillus algifaecis TaxID=1214604 RepID=A0A223CXV9_9BACL|nr:ABC transporter substrate-binding protein [Tumebacillus algifaecis]ASS74141.1 peptide ABC transporter substrate-binding protein [Tumebacillus algifaecis]